MRSVELFVVCLICMFAGAVVREIFLPPLSQSSRIIEIVQPVEPAPEPEAGTGTGEPVADTATVTTHFETFSERPPLRRWKWIVLHHSGSDASTLEGIRSWHVDHNGWDDIGYHFIILRDGEIHITERWRRQRAGAHARTRNTDGIGICLIGDFSEGKRPTDPQSRAAATLIRRLQDLYDIANENVIRHCDVAATACPGTVSLDGLTQIGRAQ